MNGANTAMGFELSVNQKKLWTLGELHNYHNEFVVEIKGPVDPGGLRAAIVRVVQRHEVLRSRCLANPGSIFPLQTAGDGENLHFMEFIAVPESVEEIRRRANAFLGGRYDAYADEPIRFFLAHGVDGKHYLFVRLYAFWGDGESCRIFIRELNAEYSGEAAAEEDQLIEYRNFSQWQNELAGDSDKKGLRFWNSYNYARRQNVLPFGKRESAGFLPQSRPLITLEHEDHSRFNRLAEGLGVTVGELTLTIYCQYLAEMSRNEITVGYIPGKRNYAELDHTIGLVSKILPYKFDGLAALPLKENAGVVRNGVEEIVAWSDYFWADTVFQYDFEYMEGRWAGDGGSFLLDSIYSVTSPFEIKLFCLESRDRLVFELYYDGGKFDAKDVAILAAQLQVRIVNALNVVDGGSRLCGLEQEIIDAANATATGTDNSVSVVSLFERQAASFPDRIALSYDSERISYGELDRRSAMLASLLQEKYGVQPGEPVAISLQRSPLMIVGLLGILRAGGAYVPIDPDYPAERIDYIVVDCGCRLLLTDGSMKTGVADQVVVLSVGDERLYEGLEPEKAIYAGDPERIAYIIYTSGSTGRPKGCMITHRNLSNYIQWANAYYFRQENEGNWGLITSFSFDLTVTAIYSSLTRGKKLHIGRQDKEIVHLLEECFNDPQIDTLKITPAHVSLLKDVNAANSAIKVIICGGEQLTREQLNNIWQINKEIRVYNEYGPTETTVGAIVKGMAPGDEKVLIGKPLANSYVNILDEKGRACPIGVAGELHIGGTGVGAGYLNRKELTLEKFLVDGSRADQRVYRTGDLGRWMPDGEIEYIGRTDDQVKIRGNRVELGEIETALLGHPAIEAAVVVTWGGRNGERELAAYFVGGTVLQVADLRAHLGNLLPDYMIPSYFVRLRALPLTANGKVDKRQLPAPDTSELGSGAEYVAPRNEAERMLVEIWKEVLGKDRVGVLDNFYDLGGHSLKVMRLAAQIHRAYDVKLGLKELFSKPVLQDQVRMIEESGKTSFVNIASIEEQTDYPVSSSQRRIWVLSQFEEGNIAYNIPGVYIFRGEMDRHSLERAFIALMKRHETLRTVFHEDEYGGVRQVIRPVDEVAFVITETDLRGRDHTEEKLDQMAQAEFIRPFDLSSGPLMRARLTRIADDQHLFTFVMHHIISDAWSTSILMNELLLLYAMYNGGKPDAMEPLRIHYKDYAVWQQEQLQGSALQEHKDYWVGQFADGVPILELPTDRPRPVVQTYNGGVVATKIGVGLTQALKRLCQEQEGTLFMGLLAAVNILLYRYSQQNDIVIGSPIAGREHADLDGQIGFYVNTMALRSRFSGEDHYKQVFAEIRKVTLGAYEHQMYPFDELVDALHLRRDVSRHPLFDVMVILQNAGDLQLSGKHSGGMEVVEYARKGKAVSKFDLTFSFEEAGEELKSAIEYNSDLYDATTIERLAGHFVRLLESIVADAELPVHQLKYLKQEEEDLLAYGFNDTLRDHRRERTVVGLLEEQAELTPYKIAIVSSGVDMSFREFNGWVNRLGRYLRYRYQVKPDDLIGIKLERGEWMMIAMFGILKAGGAYIPIDPKYPEERISYILNDSGCKVVLDEAELRQFIEVHEQFDRRNLQAINKPSDLAYVIYTSGSTGRPKGVMIEHRSIVSLFENYFDRFQLEPDMVLGAAASYTFDMSTFELLGPLLMGGTLFIISETDPAVILRYIKDRKINAMQFTPSRLGQLMDADADCLQTLSNLRMLLVGGEALSETRFHFLKSLRTTTVINAYGPTETTVWSSCAVVNECGSLHVGTPLWNEQLYIVDAFHGLCPVSVPGEICIGGEGLARGYMNNKEMTRDKFVPNPFRAGERMYKTGDMGRWLPDGNIEFIGRKDDQVKVRGYRIELGEVESALQKYADIDGAAVAVKPNRNGENELVAYLTGQETLSITGIRTHLSGILPAYMVPDHYVQLETIPLNNNGKVDRKRLPAPDEAGMSTGVSYLAPRNGIEQRLVEIWQEILGKEKIGVQDNFFGLGGHSLKATRLASLIQKAFGVKLPVSDLFLRTTPAEQAELIGRAKKTAYKDIEPISVQKDYAVSASQQRLWLADQVDANKVAYNIYGAYELEDAPDAERIRNTVQALVARHETLRTIFIEKEGQPRQVVLDADKLYVGIEVIDIAGDHDREETAIRRAIFHHAFSLDQWPLFKLSLVQNKGKYKLVFCMHHIVGDGWSLELFVRDMLTIYKSVPHAAVTGLPMLRVQYKDYANWQINLLAEDGAKALETYWKSKLGGTLPHLRLPYDFDYFIGVANRQAASFRLHLDKPLKQQIDQLVVVRKTSVFSLLIACFKVLVSRLTGETDIIIGTPVANREHEDVKDLIGFFVNTLMLRDRVDPDASFMGLLEQVQTTLSGGLAHQAYPFEKVLDVLDVKWNYNQFPISQIVLNMLNFQDAVRGLEEAAVGHTAVDGLAKFDLECYFKAYTDAISINFVYKQSLFTPETVAYWANEFVSVIRQAVADPAQRVGALRVFEKAPFKAINPVIDRSFSRFEDGEIDQSIVARFEKIVRSYPDRIAIEQGAFKLTYQGLNAMANGLARRILETSGERPGPVGLLLEHGVSGITGMLGALKAGGSYVPMDPSFPVDRLRYIVINARCRVLIADSETIGTARMIAESAEGIMVIDLSVGIGAVTENPGIDIRPENIAYILYTSGSTGEPKGVIQVHRNVLHFIRVYTNNLHIDKTDRIGLVAAYTFDASVSDIYSALLNGATLCSYPIKRDGIGAMAGFIESHRLSVLHLVPTVYRYFVEQLTSQTFGDIRLIVLGGEPIYKGDWERFRNHFDEHALLVNTYGPTESSTVLQKLLGGNSVQELTSIPLGDAVYDTEVYLINDKNERVNVYQEGEIVYKSKYLSLGYLDNDELTAAVFTPDPLTGKGRVYRSGDFGRLLPTGEIEFTGRRDSQVKLDGQRIELGEIEQQLVKVAGVEEAVVSVKPVRQQLQLVAYVKAADKTMGPDFRHRLAAILPPHMVPATFVFLDKFPQTATGKIDRRSLPDPQVEEVQEYVGPRNEIEAKLVEMWQEALGRERIGVRDNYFELGAKSLITLKVLSRIRSEFQINFKVEEVFNNTTVESLANEVQRKRWAVENAQPEEGENITVII